MKDKSSFLDVIGDSPKLRILDFLLIFRAYDYSLTDIAKNAHVSYSRLMEFWPQFISKGIVKETRLVGKARMFKLNESNPVVKQLSKLQWVISQREIRKKIEKEMLKVPAS